MANSIALAQKFQPILDEVYAAASLTAAMDARSKPIDFAGANVVKVWKTSVVGLGNYSRATGYPIGDVTGQWETMTLAIERARGLFMDREDDEESLGMAFGSLVGEFMRTAVIPEVDAFRFSKYASWSGISEVGTPATLTSSTVIDAIDVAKGALRAASAPLDGAYLYVSDTVLGFIEKAISRTLNNENVVDRRVKVLDGLQVVMVPQTRFYKGITMDAGATASAGGFTKTPTTGRDINFMLMDPKAVIQVKKHDNLKLFDPDTNQDKDGWKIQYRLYHDAFVLDNKVTGIYSHIKAS